MSETSQAKLDCLARAKANLCETVKDLERAIGSEETLVVLAGAMRSITLIDRLAARIASAAGVR